MTRLDLPSSPEWDSEMAVVYPGVPWCNEEGMRLTLDPPPPPPQHHPRSHAYTWISLPQSRPFPQCRTPPPHMRLSPAQSSRCMNISGAWLAPVQQCPNTPGRVAVQCSTLLEPPVLTAAEHKDHWCL
ncbi:unnamed protein product [Gadus morhua 'NCC']